MALGFVRFGYSLVLPAMQAGLGLSPADMGLVAGASHAAYLLGSLPAGVLATRFGARRVVVGGLLLAALGELATALAPGLATLLLGQVTAGGAIAGVIVPTLALSPGWFPPRFWGLATGIVVGGGGLGFAVSGLVVPPLIGLHPEKGWRIAWGGMLTFVLIGAALGGLLLRDPPRRLERPALLASLRAVAGRPVIWQLGGVFLLYGLAYITFGTFFTAHLVVGRGVSAVDAGQLWALNGIVGIPGAIVAGVAADRLGHRPTLVMLYAAQGASLLLLGLGASWGWYLAAALLYGFTIWSFAGVISAACGSAVGPSLAPAAVSLAVTLMSVGQMLGPVVGGLLADPDGGYTRALLVGAGADLLGLVGVLLTRLPRARPEQTG